MADSTTIASQIGPAIDVLAAKLKVPSQFVWEILVRQAYINFAVSVFAVVVMTVVNAILWRRWVRWHSEERRSYEEDVLGVITGIVAAIISLFAFVVFLSSLGDVLNPQYYALSQILRAVK